MKGIAIVLIVFFISGKSFSQSQTEKPLHIVLSDLEKKYNVVFSYPTEMIKDVKVNFKQDGQSLDEILNFLSLETNISFHRLSKNFYFLTKTETENLDKVILHGYLMRGITKKNNGTFYINTKHFGLLPGFADLDLLQTIQHLPGVVSINETTTQFSVRGGNADQNRILINKINLYNNGFLFGNISSINSHIIKKVKFHYKGTDVEFGDKLSSVIEMETLKKIPGNMQWEWGINGISSDIIFKMPVEKNKLGLVFSFRRSLEDVLEMPVIHKLEKKVFQNFNNITDYFVFNDLQAGINYKPSGKHLLNFYALHIDDDLKIDLEKNNTLNKFVNDSENDGYSLQWKADWNDKNTTDVYASYSKYMFYSIHKLIENQNVKNYKKYNHINNFLFSGTYIHKIDKYKKLKYGIQIDNKQVSLSFKKTNHPEIIFENNNSQMSTYSLFSSYELSKKRKNIYLGFRLNYYDLLKKIYLEPRFRMANKFGRFLTGHFSFEIKHQNLYQIEQTILSNLQLENKLWRLANNNKFPVLSVYHLSTGMSKRYKKWFFDSDIFYKHTFGLSSLSLGYVNPVENTFHHGEQVAFGSNLFVQYKNKNFRANLSYSFNDIKSRYKGLNNNDFFTSNNEIEHIIVPGLMYKYKFWTFSTAWFLRTGRPFTEFEDDDDDEPFEKINNEYVPFYHRLDVSVKYNFDLFKKHKLRGYFILGVRNIYNQKNIINVDYFGNNDINEQMQIVKNYSPGILPDFSLRLFW